MGIPEDLALSGQWEGVVDKQAFEPDLRVDSLYTNSKLEAEKMLYSSAAQGQAVTIYRAGNLSCRSDNGKFQKNIDSNAFYRMIKAMLLLGKAPEANGAVDLTPIDYASKSIVHLALRPDTAGRVFHICNPEQITYSQLVDMIRSCGFAIETLDKETYAEWLLDKDTCKDPEGVKLAIAGLEGDGAKDSNYRYGCAATSALVEEANIRCAAPDKSFIEKMLTYGTEIGYFRHA
jgi:thioester reductase-like protein